MAVLGRLLWRFTSHLIHVIVNDKNGQLHCFISAPHFCECLEIPWVHFLVGSGSRERERALQSFQVFVSLEIYTRNGWVSLFPFCVSSACAYWYFYPVLCWSFFKEQKMHVYILHILYTLHMHFVHVLHLQLKMGDFLNPFKEKKKNAVKLATSHPVWVRLLLLASCKAQTFWGCGYDSKQIISY